LLAWTSFAAPLFRAIKLWNEAVESLGKFKKHLNIFKDKPKSTLPVLK
jgi:hypothetical protein